MATNLLDEQLSLLFSGSPQEAATSAVSALNELYQNIRDHPGADQYKRVRIGNKRFDRCIWSHPPAKQFLLLSGWVEAGEFLVYIEDSESTQSPLDSLKKVMMSQAPSPRQQPQQQPAAGSDKSDEQKVERMKQLKEHQRKVAEEKKRIADQIKANRQETAQKESKASQARVMNFGGNINRFEDIGVDLNKGG